MADTDDPNVNSGGNASGEVNVKRLGEQQKAILRFLYSRRGRRQKQIDFIEEHYGEVTDSTKASVSRSFNRLMEMGLVFERKAYYSPSSDALISHRVNYHLTDEGEQFLEADDRFPAIEPGEDECVECGETAETYPEGTPYCQSCFDSKTAKEIREKVYGS